MGRQSERMVVIKVKRETLSQDKEQWVQQEVRSHSAVCAYCYYNLL